MNGLHRSIAAREEGEGYNPTADSTWRALTVSAATKMNPANERTSRGWMAVVVVLLAPGDGMAWDGVSPVQSECELALSPRPAQCHKSIRSPTARHRHRHDPVSHAPATIESVRQSAEEHEDEGMEGGQAGSPCALVGYIGFMELYNSTVNYTGLLTRK